MDPLICTVMCVSEKIHPYFVSLSGLYLSSIFGPTLWCVPPLQPAPSTHLYLLFSFQTFLQHLILLSSALSPIFSRHSASQSSFDCLLAFLFATSFFDPPLLSQSLNTFNLLSSSLICHSIHCVLPFIISPYRPPPSVLLLSACLNDGFKDPLSPLSPSQYLIYSILALLNVCVGFVLTCVVLCNSMFIWPLRRWTFEGTFI